MKHTVKKEVKEPTTEEKYEALNEKYIRLLAEYDNYRKRKDREVSELIKTANEKLLAGLC